YSTYLGGTSLEDGESIRVDAAGDAYVSGGTSSTDFPITAGAYQKHLLKACTNETCNGFVTKVSPDGSQLVWSTYFSFPSNTYFFQLAVDTANDVIISGKTGGGGLRPTPGTYTTKTEGNYGDAFVAKLRSDGSGLLFLSYFGGSKWDGAQGVAVDAADNIWIGGRTSSPDLPLTTGAWNGPCTP